MAYVIAEPRIGTKDTACVDACPVDCTTPRRARLTRTVAPHSRTSIRRFERFHECSLLGNCSESLILLQCEHDSTAA